MDMYGYRGPNPVVILAALVLGAVFGAVLGLLFAPKSGKETREIIAVKSQEYYDQGKEMYATGASKAGDAYASGKQAATDQFGKVRDKVSKKDEAPAEPVEA
jgi:gas vesicle protein